MMATKNPTVTKKQLEESGFDNLRDYMNAERGLTRKDGKVALRKGDMDIKSAAEKRSTTRMADVAAKKPQAERRSDARLRAGRASATSSDEANMMDMPLSATGSTISSMDTDVMRTNSRTAAKEAGASRKSSAEAAAKAKDKKTFGALNRTETNRAQRETAMRDDKASYKKGGSIDGCAVRGHTRGKQVKMR
jgi:hypothetical protein